MAIDFPIRDLGDLKFFLGIEVDRVKEGLHPSQSQCLANLLRTCDMDSLKPAVIPMFPNFDLNAKSRPILETKEYMRMIGSLQYITLTQPNVQLAVNWLSQFMANPTQVH